MKGKPTGAKVERSAHLRWVPLGRMRVNPLAQRDLNQARVDKLVAEFDPEQLGTPVVNHRGECFYVIDGQHRFEALKVWLGEGWQSQQVQCEAYEGMSEHLSTSRPPTIGHPRRSATTGRASSPRSPTRRAPSSRSASSSR